jgi:Family of unknown function (DUF6502)
MPEPTPQPAAQAAGPGAGGAVPMDPQALLAAMRELLQPLAELAVGQGVLLATVEEMLKSAFVNAARAAHATGSGERVVSRVSTVTGLNRREVTRLIQAEADPVQPKPSPATRVFTRWLSDPLWKTAAGEPLALPRQGAAPSFEALAQSVTRDVHPRSLLDELCRLGLARLEGDTVHAASRTNVPRGDSARMLGFLGSNVGDHLRASIANVLADAPPHFEQAVFADGLSAASLDAAKELVREQWKTLLAATAPALQKMIDADQAAGLPTDQRVRIGLYSYAEPTAATARRAPTGAAPPVAKAAARKTSAASKRTPS